MKIKIYFNILFFLFLLNNIAYSFQFSLGSFENPIIDSCMTWDQAVNKKFGIPIPSKILNQQVLINVLYYSFDNKIHQGQIVVHKNLADDIKKVFFAALNEKFPFASVIPVSDSRFNWDDSKNMAANNTSGFNYRKVFGGNSFSKHAFGMAVDINPLFNPYIKNNIIQPPKAQYKKNRPGTLTSDSLVVKTFLSLGWTWGGHWKTLKDYQHFHKNLFLNK